MGIYIKKIHLINFKRFRNFSLQPNEGINILIGDNEAGKSSILEAIDIVSGGNTNRIEKNGIERLLNIDAVKEFLAGDKSIDNLPKMIIELYLSEGNDFTLSGKNNEDKKTCDGIRLVCEPNIDYINEIKSAIDANKDYFPYDYYSIRFSTFADEAYSGYKKKLRCVIIDSSRMNSDYATNDFIHRCYTLNMEGREKEKANHKKQYRELRNSFKDAALNDLNKNISLNDNYCFGLKNGGNISLENDLMIFEDNVAIDCKGAGKQIFIKTNFALNKANNNTDVILIEEPENHLSPVNLRKLLKMIQDHKSGQLFVTTHSSMICTRLEVNNLIIMDSDGNNPLTLNMLSTDTSDYFSKTPPASIVEFVLSKKVILVEGPAEFMLMEKFFKRVTNQSPEENGVHVIDVRGLSFKRYLEVAKEIGIKVAVITDNDSDYEKNCEYKYREFNSASNIRIFAEKNNDERTFEIVLYNKNQQLCDELFKGKTRKKIVDWMVTNNNKTEAAYTLLSIDRPIEVPNYIKDAIEWISE